MKRPGSLTIAVAWRVREEEGETFARWLAGVAAFIVILMMLAAGGFFHENLPLCEQAVDAAKEAGNTALMRIAGSLFLGAMFLSALLRVVGWSSWPVNLTAVVALGFYIKAILYAPIGMARIAEPPSCRLPDDLTSGVIWIGFLLLMGLRMGPFMASLQDR